MSLAIWVSELLDELVSESRGSEYSSLGEENSRGNISSMLSPVSYSSVTRPEISEETSVGSNPLFDGLLGIVAQVHDVVETDMEDNTML